MSLLESIKTKQPTKNSLLVAIIGESGCGKSSIIDDMALYVNFFKLESYTTRPKRHDTEKGHRFVSEDDYAFIYKKGSHALHCIVDIYKKEIVKHLAYTNFNGYHYWASENQIVPNSCTLYTIDPAGLEDLQKNYTGRILTFYLKSSESTRKARMLERGDSIEKVEERLAHDAEAFRFIKCDYVIDVNHDSIQDISKLIRTICVKEMEC